MRIFSKKESKTFLPTPKRSIFFKPFSSLATRVSNAFRKNRVSSSSTSKDRVASFSSVSTGTGTGSSRDSLTPSPISSQSSFVLPGAIHDSNETTPQPVVEAPIAEVVFDSKSEVAPDAISIVVLPEPVNEVPTLRTLKLDGTNSIQLRSRIDYKPRLKSIPENDVITFPLWIWFMECSHCNSDIYTKLHVYEEITCKACGTVAFGA